MSELEAVQQIRRELEEAAQLGENLKGTGWLATSVVRRISSKYFRVVKHLSKCQLFDLREDLLGLGDWPERAIAFDWAFRCDKP
jgi:hypothetical protein